MSFELQVPGWDPQPSTLNPQPATRNGERSEQRMGTYKDLDIWKESMALVRAVYRISNQLPDTQKYSLVSQMQRSAISIPSNIAEGSARHTDKESIQFLYIALGSIAELNTQLILVEDLGYAETQTLQNDCDRIRKKILNLIKYLKTRNIANKKPQ